MTAVSPSLTVMFDSVVQVPQTGLELPVLRKVTELLVLLPLSPSQVLRLKAGTPVLVLFILLLNFLVTSFS